MDFVRLGGKKRPVHFGFNALRVFCSATGRTLDHLGDEMTLDDSIKLVMAGLENGARIQREDFSVGIEEVCDWLDNDPKAYTEIIKVYAESLPNLFPPTKQ